MALLAHRRSLSLDAWAALVVAATCAADLLLRLRPLWALPGAFEDDFFYYAVIARNMARGRGPTFDGAHLTNGFHPLWQLYLAALWRLGGGRLFLPLVTLTTAAALAAIFLLTRRCLQRLGVAPPRRTLIAALTLFWSGLLLGGGMEINLAVPLLLLLLAIWLDPRPRRASRYAQLGFVASLAILARLDAALLIALLLPLTLLQETAAWPQHIHRASAFAAGLTPLWLYLACNELYFKTLMPISAQAKQMRLHHSPQWRPILDLIYPLTGIKIMVVLPGIAGAATLLTLLTRRREQFRAHTRPVLWALALFPIVQMGTLCIVSDWRQIFYWYFYPMLLAAMAGCAACAITSARSRLWPIVAAALMVVCAVHEVSYHLRHPPGTNPMLLAARDIAAFAATHPGAYAMGDRAGMPAYLIDQPMVQLEGLVMDGAYLARLRTQPPLTDVLRDYGVDYYIATNAIPEASSARQSPCYRVTEPAQAGRDSPVMHATLCQAPLASFTHGGFITQIFAVHGNGPSAK